MNLSQNTCIRKQKFCGFGGIKRTTFFRVQNQKNCMTKHKTNPNSFYYQQTHKGSNYEKRNFWSPGDPVQEKDAELLRVVQDFYGERGYVPSRGELEPEIAEVLKARFRTWKNVLLAAGLPAMNDAETQMRRQKIKKNTTKDDT